MRALPIMASASSPLAMGRERKGVAGGTAAREKSVAERHHSRGEQHQGLEPPSTAGMAQEVLQQARSLLGRVTCSRGTRVRSGGRRDTHTASSLKRESEEIERNVNIFVHVLNVSFRIPRFIPHLAHGRPRRSATHGTSRLPSTRFYVSGHAAGRHQPDISRPEHATPARTAA